MAKQLVKFYAKLGILTYFLLEKSFLGYQLKAIRENELAARSLGINVPLVRNLAFAFSCFIAGAFGGAYGYWLTYLHPDNVLSPFITDQMVVMTLIGGMGTIGGPVIGAIVLYLINRLTWLYFGEGVYYFMILGLLVCFTIIFLPEGIMGLISRKTGKKRSIKENLAQLQQKVKI